MFDIRVQKKNLLTLVPFAIVCNVGETVGESEWRFGVFELEDCLKETNIFSFIQ